MWYGSKKDTVKDDQEEKEKSIQKLKVIALDTLRYAKQSLMVGKQILEYVEGIEGFINEKGCLPAFPVNVSIDEVAAHYTPQRNDTLEFTEKMVAKIDIGIALNGYVADFAFTCDFSDTHQDLLEASSSALAVALEEVKVGMPIGELGRVIEENIRAKGKKPIANLSGHMIEKNCLHAGVNVPNVASSTSETFENDKLYALEPFATEGEGYVEERDQVEIFSVSDHITMPRMRHTREVLNFLKKEYPNFPFAERWLYKKFDSRLVVATALRELMLSGAINLYPVLADKGLVAQFETTVWVRENDVVPLIEVAELLK